MAVLRQAVQRAALVTQVALFVRIDARRPASWLMLAAAAGCWAACQWLGLAGWQPARAGMAAFVAGAVLAVGASGDLPVAACHALPGRGARIALLWLAERAVWPACGLVATAMVSPFDSASPGILIAAVSGLVAAAGMVLAGRWRGANAADAASLSLISAAAAGAAGATCASTGGMLPGLPEWTVALAVALAVWLAIGLAVLIIDWRMHAATDWLPDSQAGPRLLRTWLTAMAMATSLAAMVAWLFLDPSHAKLFPALALAWFTALAVPEAMFGAGVSDDAGWRRLLRSAADARPWWHLRRSGRGQPPLADALLPAAMLGWPPLVAMVLAGGEAAAVRAAALTLLGLAAAAAALMLCVWLLAGEGMTAESAQAVVLAGALAVAVLLAAGGFWSEAAEGLPRSPDLPPPGWRPLPAEHGGANPAQDDWPQ